MMMIQARTYRRFHRLILVIQIQIPVAPIDRAYLEIEEALGMDVALAEIHLLRFTVVARLVDIGILDRL
jgi:hypothetical protein